MKVEVNETNIALFELVQLTGNSREELLNAAADASANGYTLYCEIPEPDEKLEVNAFEHFDSEPAPKVADAKVTSSDRQGWENVYMPERNETHVLPHLEDGHEPENCICKPTTEAVKREDGSVGWLITHNAFDGRE